MSLLLLLQAVEGEPEPPPPAEPAYQFTPPVDNVVPPVYVGMMVNDGHDPSGWQDTHPAIHRLMSRYRPGPRGRNVFLLTNNTVTEVQPAEQEDVARIFWGASTHSVSAAEKTILEAAGYTVVTL